MNDCYPFENTPLPYDPDSMEPYIDGKTMRIHHDRHLQTYVDNLNGLLKNRPEFQGCTLEELLLNIDRLPSAMQIPVRNNAGGVYNHRFYFDGLKNFGKEAAHLMITEEIKKQFGSLEEWKEQFKKAALSVFGSGYAWLVFREGMLEIFTTPNQNTPLETCMYPILNIDVWEHAYYLKHYNKRADYFEDWYHVINWEKANERFQRAESSVKKDGE